MGLETLKPGLRLRFEPSRRPLPVLRSGGTVLGRRVQGGSGFHSHGGVHAIVMRAQGLCPLDEPAGFLPGITGGLLRTEAGSMFHWVAAASMLVTRASTSSRHLSPIS